MRTAGRLAGFAVLGSVLLALLPGCREPDQQPTEPALATVAKRTLTVSGSGKGDGVVTSTPAGINCTITGGIASATGCSFQFDKNTVVTLAAVPKAGHAFVAWFQYCAGFTICQVTMSSNRSVQARFMKGPFTVKIGSGVSGSGRGTVRSQTGLSPVINCVITDGVPASTGCSAKYPANTEVVLTATPANGYGFGGWGGTCGGEGTCHYKAVKNVTIPASFLPAATPAAATVGRWGPAFQTPVVGIHLHLLPSGIVALWGNRGETNLWNPADPGAGFVPLSKPYQIFCAGHTLLPDGRLLIAGGHISSDRGLPGAVIFDPATSSWTPAPALAQGRWYPTLTTLPNGDVLTVAGADEQGTMVAVPEVWRNGGWARLTGAPLTLPYYPFMFVAPNGRVFMAGPERTTRYIDPSGSGSWTTVAQRIGPVRDYGSAVMYAPGKVLAAGGGDPPTASAEVIDLNDPSPGWRAVAPMAYARRQTMATILADGQVLVTHGTSGAGFNDLSNTVRYAELWNPSSETWTTMAREGVGRAYHSSAILLPDGRVLSSGSGESDGLTFSQSELSAQIFSPPYLFNGDGTAAPRPRIGSAPDRLSYGESFEVGSPDAGSVARGTLIRLSSTTHSFNQSQRIYHLTLTQAGGGALAGVAPGSPRLAPPGPYLLFLITGTGVPSVAKIVSLGP